MSTHPSRRTVVRTAAWAVPAVTVVGAAPHFAASFVTMAPTSATFPAVPAALTSPLETDLGNWEVTVTLDLPTVIHEGDVTPVPNLTIEVTIDAATADLLVNTAGATTVNGTATVPYQVGADALTGTVTIPDTTADAAGFTVVATGVGGTFTAGPAGAVTVTMGLATINMNMPGALFPTATLTLDMTGMTLGSFTIS